MTTPLSKIDNQIVREELASYAHKAWSGWMDYLFEKSILSVDGTAIIPAWAVERWKRQAKTPYEKLPDGEKESDRAEADAILNIVQKPLQT